jgi:hypothetical protein
VLQQGYFQLPILPSSFKIQDYQHKGIWSSLKFLLSQTNCTIPLSYLQLQCDGRYSTHNQLDIIGKPTAIFTIKIRPFFPRSEKLVCSGVIGLERYTIP